MKRYEIKVAETDAFDIMCGECQEHEIEYWKEVSLEELHNMHESWLQAEDWMTEFDKQMYEEINGEEWQPTPVDFEEFLREEIQNGNIRVTEE